MQSTVAIKKSHVILDYINGKMDSLMRELTIYPFYTFLVTPKILCSSLGITFLKDIKLYQRK